MKNVPYPVALANNIVGYDIYPGEPDILAQFNSSVSWYYGTDGNTPASQIDFVTVVLHEICHGLGFASSAESNNTASSTFIGRSLRLDDKEVLSTSIYDKKLENGGGTKVTAFPNYSMALLDVLTSESVFFDDVHARAANKGNRVPLYAPAIFDQGSSISHLAESFYWYIQCIDDLFTAIIRVHTRSRCSNPGILEDLGWSINQNCFPTYVYVNKNIWRC